MSLKDDIYLATNSATCVQRIQNLEFTTIRLPVLIQFENEWWTNGPVWRPQI